MRLNIVFVGLLLLATLAVGSAWKEFSAARDGDALARAVVFAAAPVAFVAIALLTRIVARVDAVRKQGRS